MRFMMLMIPKGYEKASPGTMPDPKAIGAMMKYNESLQKAGVLLALDGLHPPSMGSAFQLPKMKSSRSARYRRCRISLPMFRRQLPGSPTCRSRLDANRADTSVQASACAGGGRCFSR